MPKITNSQDEDRNILKGSTLNLTCKAIAYPDPDTKFLRNGEVISTSRNFSIPKVEMSDEGQYICQAENIVGISQKIININVTELPKITSNFKNITLVTEDQFKKVTCTAKAIPDPTIKWNFEDSTLVVNGPVLNLTSFNDRGIYTCVATNSEGTDKKSFYADIRRLNPYKNIKNISRIVVVKENEDFELVCPYKNYLTINWNLNHQKMPSDIDYKEEKNKLIVKEVKRNQNGIFSCQVENYKEKFTFSYNVDVLAIPIITPSWVKNNLTLNYSEISDIEEHQFEMGDKLTFSCNVSGNPAPNVKWFKGKLKIDDGEVYSIIDLKSKHR